LRQRVNSKENRDNATDGITNTPKDRLQTGEEIDPFFPERTDVYPIQPYPGDIIFEGRWGQSIRFGSTIDTRNIFNVYPLWSAGQGASGNPITIISNGTNPSPKGMNSFTIENPDKDDSSIWLTSGQSVRFNPASRTYPSIRSKKINSYRNTQYAGNQILLASERIILNARENEIIGFSKRGVGFSSEGSISLDGKNFVEAEAKRIHLGVNAVSPALLGDKTMVWLNQLCTLLTDLIDTIVNATYPTALGPTTGPPLNMSKFLSISSEVDTIKDKIDTLKSNLVFLNENSGGPSEEAQSGARRNEQVGTYESYDGEMAPTDTDTEETNEWGERKELTPEDEYLAKNDDAILGDDEVEDNIVP